MERTFDTKPYTDLKARQQREFDAFSDQWCFYAFSNQQLEEGLSRLKPKLSEGEKVVRFGAGCFCAKSKVSELSAMSKRFHDELRDAMGDRAFARGAFLYEMNNHEYGINWQADWDVCNCFAPEELEYGDEKTFRDYLLAAGYGTETLFDYRDARREHFRIAEEEGWY